MEHKLKTWPEFFKHIWSGEKTFELRKDDRGFRAGDTLRLQEWSKSYGYTGREVIATATYILSNGFGLKADWVIIALRHLTPVASDAESRCICAEDEWDPVPEHNICIACGKPRR